MHRRRQAQSYGGIFVLGQSGDDKYHRRRRRRRQGVHRIRSVVFSLAAAVAIACFLRWRRRSLSRAPAPAPGGATAAGNGTSVEASKENDTEAEMPKVEPPRIPRRLVFTYTYNLLAPSKDEPPLDFLDPLTANVLRTVSRYEKFWEADDARRGRTQEQKENVTMSFLSDAKCLAAIAAAEPRLVRYFSGESRGDYKADLCRLSELYLHGGYCFDVDVGVLDPVDLDALDIPELMTDPLWNLRATMRRNSLSIPGNDDIATFATVYGKNGLFFQGFTAATAGHPLLKKSLEYALAYYQGSLRRVLPRFILDQLKARKRDVPSRAKRGGIGPGSFALSVAYRTTTFEEWSEHVADLMKDVGYIPERGGKKTQVPNKRTYSRFLHEISLEEKEVRRMGLWDDLPLQSEKNPNCNFICFGGRRAYFYSKIVGSEGCPEEKKIEEDEGSDKEGLDQESADDGWWHFDEEE